MVPKNGVRIIDPIIVHQWIWCCRFLLQIAMMIEGTHLGKHLWGFLLVIYEHHHVAFKTVVVGHWPRHTCKYSPTVAFEHPTLAGNPKFLKEHDTLTEQLQERREQLSNYGSGKLHQT